MPGKKALAALRKVGPEAKRERLPLGCPLVSIPLEFIQHEALCHPPPVRCFRHDCVGPELCLLQRRGPPIFRPHAPEVMSRTSDQYPLPKADVLAAKRAPFPSSTTAPALPTRSPSAAAPASARARPSARATPSMSSAAEALPPSPSAPTSVRPQGLPSSHLDNR